MRERKTHRFLCPIKISRLFSQILRDSGFTVDVVSQLRARVANPNDVDKYQQLLDDAKAEITFIEKRWERLGPPAIWFCYHPYYKSPDLLGPYLCQTFDIPYSQGFWAQTQQRVVESIDLATVNVYFTDRDR